jgi:hypothetical protein
MPSELSSLQKFCLEGIVKEGTDRWNFEIVSDSPAESESEEFKKMQELGKKITEKFQAIAQGRFIGSIQELADADCQRLRDYTSRNIEFDNVNDLLNLFVIAINSQLYTHDDNPKPWRPLVGTKKIFLNYLIIPEVRKIYQGYDLSIISPDYDADHKLHRFSQQLIAWTNSHSSNSLLFILSPENKWEAHLIENIEDEPNTVLIDSASSFNDELMSIQRNEFNGTSKLQALLREKILFDDALRQKLFNANNIFQKTYNFLVGDNTLENNICNYEDQLRDVINELESSVISKNIKDSIQVLNSNIKDYVDQYKNKKNHLNNLVRNQLKKLVKGQKRNLKSQCGTLMTIIDKERKLNKSKSAKQPYDLVTDLVLNDALIIAIEMLTNLKDLAKESAIKNPTKEQKAKCQYAKGVLNRSLKQCEQFAEQLSGHHGASSWQKKLAGALLMIAGIVLAIGGALTIIGTLGSGVLPGVAVATGGVALIAAGVGFFASGRHKNLKKTLEDVAETVDEYKSKF